MLRRGAVLVLLAGCRQLLGFEPATTGDAAVVAGEDSVGDAPATFCLGTVETICLATKPTADLTVPMGSTLTVDSTSCQAGSATVEGTTLDACVLVGDRVEIVGTLRAFGERPLVVFAASMLHVTGSIDVSTRRGFTGQGAGARACGTQGGVGGGGGAGGSLVALGGNGGGGNGGPGGTATPAMLPFLAGGCEGGVGAGTVPVSGGAGGGAVMLLAPVIDVEGSIDAAGAGGSPSQSGPGGGGGGGSGGMIELDASSLLVLADRARLLAEGGGGGGGAAGAQPGGEASITTLLPGVGGTGDNRGGDGSLDGPGGAGQPGGGKGGGGGGGGSGRIRVHAASMTMLGGQTSPAIEVVP